MSTATMNGAPVLRGAVSIPSWGLWTADIEVASGTDLSGPVELDFAGASLVGFARGGVDRDRGSYRVVAGAGGWRTTIAPIELRNEAGVKLSAALSAAARACGETMGTVVDRRMGPAYGCPEAEASRTLDVLCPEAWYVDEEGLTNVGARPSATVKSPIVIEERFPGGQLLRIAAEDVSELVPGALVEGARIVSVRHDLTPDKIRSHVHLASPEGDRLVGIWRRLVRTFTRETFYFGRYEYRIEKVSGQLVDVRPMRSAKKLPAWAALRVRQGLSGLSSTPPVGSSCDVMYLDGDPTRPVVVGWEDTDTGGLGRVIRSGDKVALSGFTGGPVVAPALGDGGTLTLAPSVALTEGPPGFGRSRGLA